VQYCCSSRFPWSSCSIVRVDAVPVYPARQPFGIANEPTFHRSVGPLSLAELEESLMVAYILFGSEELAEGRCLPVLLLGDVSVPFVHSSALRSSIPL
jgi:hypothetical protein